MKKIFKTIIVLLSVLMLVTACTTFKNNNEEVDEESKEVIVEKEDVVEEEDTKEKSEDITDQQTDETKEKEDKQEEKTDSSKDKKDKKEEKPNTNKEDKETPEEKTDVTDEEKDVVEDKNDEEETTDTNVEVVITDNYIEFGSYPQREVVSQISDSGVYGKAWETDNDVIVDENLYNTLKNLAEDKWDANGDTTIDGNKYRRIKASDATYSTQDDINYYDWLSDETYHYFKYEPIRWRILEQNGNELFVISEIALDDQMYNTNITNLTWETSTIRSWLNGYDSSSNLYGTDYSNSNFIDTAFTQAEKAMIKTSTITNEDNIKSGTEGGNDTNDKLFLLSESEVYGDSATSYGFNSNYDNHDEARQLKSSTYAKAMGVYSECETEDLGNCFWWLRSPGSYTGLFILVRCNGSVYRGGQHANSKSRGVCPCMHIIIENE